MNIAFTGTRQGMTVSQQGTVRELLIGMEGGTVHHGCCHGADREFHRIAYVQGYRIVLHPGDTSQEAWALTQEYCDGIYPLKHSLSRNRQMVDETTVLIATPQTEEEVLRSGIWATIRYARKCDRVIYVIRPDGEVIKEPQA